LVNEIYEQGIVRVSDFISQFPRWKRLTSTELKRYPQKFSAGWEVTTTLEGERVNLRILVTSDFPFKPPRIAIFPARPVLFWPHLEEAGTLCLLADSAPFSVENLEDEVKLLLREAVTLVSACIRGEGFEEFEDEFQSYWDRRPRKIKGYYSLCTPDEKSRWVYSCLLSAYRLVADDKESIKKWLTVFGHKPHKFDIDAIPLIHIGKPLRPSEYPRNFGDFLDIIMDNTEAFQTIEKYITTDFKKRKQILLSFKGRRGTGFAGLVLPEYDESLIKRRTPLKGPRHKGIEHIRNGGFRFGLPSNVFYQRYCALLVDGAKVTRCDAPWIHGRDQDTSVSVLQSKTVVAIGAGSLGSGVIELLAKAGVKKIIIVDPEILLTENVCRHSLGISSVGQNKSAELKNLLSKRFPHLEFEDYQGNWEYMYGRTPAKISSADLIMSTVGGWRAESLLNALVRTTPGFPPVLIGWLEPHAAAAHAIAFFKYGCLRCLTDDKGIPKLPVTQWPEEGTLLQVPMCGGMFQPYGAIELSHGQSLVADLAFDILLGNINETTHRTWIGQEKLLAAGKGKWNPDWTREHGNPDGGGKICTIAVNPDPMCPICKGEQMTYKYGLEHDGPYVILAKSVIETISRYRQLSKDDNEAGGQLFAVFEGSDTQIVEATEPKMFDKRSRCGFVPSRFIQKIEIKSRHKEGKHFVGDWHSHPEPIPTPSDLDLNSMADCFRKSRHELLSFLMIIIGTSNPPKGLFVCLVNDDGVRKLRLIG